MSIQVLKGRKKCSYEEFNFEPESLYYQKSTTWHEDENPIITSVEKKPLKREYTQFLTMLLEAGFVGVSDSVHFEHETFPPLNTYTYYKLELLWLGNGRSFETLELHHDEYYGLDYKDREKFATFEKYLFSLAERK